MRSMANIVAVPEAAVDVGGFLGVVVAVGC